MPKLDICVIGAGSAGLSIAAGAAQMGARTILIEAHRMGGDCLYTGCVPSKSLLAAAKIAHSLGDAARFGVHAGETWVDFAAAQRHVQTVIKALEPNDSIERFQGLGVQVIKGHARFRDSRTVQVDGQTIEARRFVIATGSHAAVPPIPGLDQVPYFTNENIFENVVRPEHLIVIGGGPIGCEMSQAHRRLGARVSLIDQNQILPKDDPAAASIVRDKFVGEGIALFEKARIKRVEKLTNGVAIVLNGDSAEQRLEGSHLLVATGRKASIDDLGLDAAGIQTGPQGLVVDSRLRTTNPRVYAAGDAAGRLQFTHLASYHAGIVIRNALFRLPAKTNLVAFPWVTYTDPEVAQVGLTESEARKRYGAQLRVLHSDFAENDRAQAEGRTDGFLKVMVGRGGKILGATIVGHNAGELLLPWVLALSQGLAIGAMANLIAPYPTLSEVSKRAAGSFYTPTLFSPTTRALVRVLGWLG